MGAHAGTFSDKVRWRFPYAAFALLDADPNLVSSWLVPGYSRLEDTAVFNRVLDNVSDAPVQLLGSGGVLPASGSGSGSAPQSADGEGRLLTSRLDDVIPLELPPALRMRWEAASCVFLKVRLRARARVRLRARARARARGWGGHRGDGQARAHISLYLPVPPYISLKVDTERMDGLVP